MAFPCTSFGATGLVFLFATIDKKAGKNDVLVRAKLASLRDKLPHLSGFMQYKFISHSSKERLS